jgi:phosphopantothenoylcysteine decarboxylase/phosphopantothenate--cysteine ligase
MLSEKRIILGITGGIAAYKAAFLLRALQKAGAEVRVIMTPAAAQFVGVETFTVLSGHEVSVQVLPRKSNSDGRPRHIEWGEWADLFIIAPCTANSLAKIACGLADNMLTATILAARSPLLICPTMDGAMYQTAAVQKNLERIRSFGYHILEPEEGYLASGLTGKGRLPEIDTILQEADRILSNRRQKGALDGKKVVVTAGPTREYLDPVRFLSNPSSGKMGFAMAQAALSLGADVLLIHGPVHLEKPGGVETIEIESAEELFKQVKNHADADVVIMAAAVADFTPEDYHSKKVKKGEGGASTVELRQTTDILGWLGKHKKKDQTLIGFAMETENLIANASQKLKQKNLDWIAANSITDESAGFESEQNTVQLINKNGEQEEISGPKEEVAAKILQVIFGG